jgi:hypothetical protein
MSSRGESKSEDANMKSPSLAVRDLRAMNTSEEENDRRPDDAEAPILNNLMESEMKSSDQGKEERDEESGEREGKGKEKLPPGMPPLM